MSYDTVKNIFDFWVETNLVTNQFFSYFFLLCVFIISYMVLSNFDNKNVLLSCSFLTAVIGFLMFIATLIPFTVFMATLILLGVAIFWAAMSGE